MVAITDDTGTIMLRYKCLFIASRPNSISTFYLLQAMCRLMFTRMPMDLLSNPPPTVAERLEKLLEECSRPGPSQIDWNLFNELKSLLTSSVEEKIVNL